MAHALRRISYATCDPEHSLFSFLAREPKGHFSQQYCHSFITQSANQAEELNSIVGNAFRMAYAAQLQKQPTFQDVIASQLDQTQTNKVLWTKELSVTLKKDKSPPPATRHNNKNHHQQQQSEMDVHDAQTIRIAPPNTLAGLQPPHLKYNVLGPTAPDKAAIDGNAPPLLSSSQTSTPSSDENNSPTEMNTYKRMTEKPPLIKRLAMGLTGGNNHHHHHHHDDTNEDDSCPLVVSDGGSTPGSPTNRPLSGGYVNETVNDADTRTRADNNAANNLKNGGGMVESINSNNLTPKHIEIDNNRLLQSSSPACTEQEFKTKRISQISSSSSSSCQRTIDSTTTTTTTVLGFTPIPPPLPERTDSLNNKEEGELRTAPWFQAGIPREIALEILAQEPVGAFMVRESTSKPGCFALSLRVPRSFQPTGIAHYLIVRANKGYKIKGFTKEFMTLTSLITHHSVMPELLPCPLSLSRYNPSFVRTDSKRDFADIDLEPDYNTLADFRKMMADLNV